MTTPTASEPHIEYPDTDGRPVAENTLQFQWIMTLQGNLDGMYRDDPNVFVAGDLLWYPVEGHPEITIAPDALVAFGRPKGYRGSYQQWREGNISPQVVFEVLSPGNRFGEMLEKFRFYDRYGVEEYYLYDPDRATLEGWRREAGRLQEIPSLAGWISPRLGIRFDTAGEELVIYRPDGKRFLTFLELLAAQEEARKQADQAKQEADRARMEAEQERQRAARLAEQLRALGHNPED